MKNRLDLVNFYLSRHKGFSKLDENEKVSLVSSVLSFGVKVAKDIVAEYETSDPRKLAEEMGITVQGEEGGIKERLIRWSEYRKKRKEILIYRDSLNILLRRSQDDSMVFEQPIKLLIAHELFHHLEEEKFGLVSDKFKAVVKIGPFRFKKKFKFLSEVAAHAFVETLLDLSCSPIVFESLSLPKEVKDPMAPVLEHFESPIL